VQNDLGIHSPHRDVDSGRRHRTFTEEMQCLPILPSQYRTCQEKSQASAERAVVSSVA
jgi:hypothetical protein